MGKLEKLFARGERLAFVLAVGATPLVHHPAVGGRDPVVEAKSIFIVWLVGFTAVLRGLRILCGAPRRALGWSPLGLLAASWAAVAAVSLLRCGEANLFFRESLLQWAFLLWLWLLAGAAEPRRALGPCLVVGAVAGGLVAALGLAQFLFPQTLVSWLPYGGSAGDARNLVFSSLGNPEYLGGYLAAALVLNLCLALKSKSSPWRLVLGLAIALEVVVLLLTGARGAWLGALAGGAVAVAMEKAQGWKITAPKLLAALALAATVAAAIFVVFSTANPLNPYRANLWGRVVELGDPRSESVRHRVAIAAAAARMIARRPILGVGPGRFSVEFYHELETMLAEDKTGAVASYLELLQGRTPDHAHNDPLEIWAETGTAGFVLFALIIAWGLALMRRGGLAPAAEAWAVRAAVAVSFALLVESLFSFPLHLPTRGIVFWTFFGLGAAAGADILRNVQEPTPTAPEPQP